MSIVSYEDKLEVLGVLAGAFLILVAFGALAGTPWSTASSAVVALFRAVGIVLIAAVGVVMIQVAYSGDIREKLPGRSSTE